MRGDNDFCKMFQIVIFEPYQQQFMCKRSSGEEHSALREISGRERGHVRDWVIEEP